MTRLVAVTTLVGLCLPSLFAQTLSLKARRPESKHSRLAAAEEGDRSRDPGRVYRIVQFPHEPAAAEWTAVHNSGARVLQYVPSRALLVAAPADWNAAAAGAIHSEQLAPSDKWSPALETLPDNRIAAPMATAPESFLIEFFPDVTLADQRSIVTIENLLIRDRPDLQANHLLVEGTREQAAALTRWREVAYVFPASEDLLRGRAVEPCIGAMVAGTGIGQYVERVGEGWDGSGANAVQLKFTLGAIPAKLNTDQAIAEIHRALKEWSRVARIDFLAAAGAGGSRQIDIFFADGAHGDPFAFDGQGKVLAHTFFPAGPNAEPIAGDMHLDEAERWQIGADTDLYSVVLHELGHALGLAHSDQPGAVMYAYYRKHDALTQEDIDAIRSMYAARQEGEPAAAPAPAPTPDPAPAPAPAPKPEPEAPKPANEGDKVKPAIAITAPAATSLASAATVQVRGTASDNVGVVKITWETNTGRTGVAQGTARWTADVPVITGINTIVVRAFDAAGNTSWRSVVVTRR
jgi:hypothetical protein